jgi:hypothetical protein
VKSRTRVLKKVPDQTLRTFGAGGTAVANAPGFDWGPMAGSLAAATSFPARFAAGNSPALATAPPEIFVFTCRKAGAKVRCANAVGDLFVYTPSATE